MSPTGSDDQIVTITRGDCSGPSGRGISEASEPINPHWHPAAQAARRQIEALKQHHRYEGVKASCDGSHVLVTVGIDEWSGTLDAEDRGSAFSTARKVEAGREIRFCLRKSN